MNTNIESYEITYHCEEERKNRLRYITGNLGYGQIVFCKAEKKIRYALTDTGILFVLARHKDLIITGYLPSPSKVVKLYKSCGQKVPHDIYETVLYNSYTIKRIAEGLSVH